MNYNDPNLYLPGGQGLIRFPEQLSWRLSGDEDRAEAFRGAALQLKAGLDNGNVNALDLCSASRRYDDGTVVEVLKRNNFYELSIYSPHMTRTLDHEPVEIIPHLEQGQFYWIPGCFARYGFQDGRELQNEILLKAGSVSGDTKNEGFGVSFENLSDVGITAPGTSPDGSITRQYRTCRFEGAEPDSGYSGSRLNLSSAHIPAEGAFTISCVVRLREPIQADYSFQYRTAEIGNGYAVWNPIKVRLLTSGDGITWEADCPGSIAPLVGYKIPSKFSDHWVNFTYPWPTYNENFVAGAEKLIGYREIGTTCPGEPLMTSDYDPASPYWDKVVTVGLESLSGEFTSGWAENVEVQNVAPYASYCKFKVAGGHGKEVGTRAVGALSDGGRRYSTVHAVEYEYNPDDTIKATIFTLKDYQYKLFMTDAVPTVSFGDQPFPVSHPEGYMIGINFMGLCWLNGERIIAGKVCDFETEYHCSHAVSEKLDIGKWYHVCMTYGDDGKVALYVTKLGSMSVSLHSAFASTERYINETGFGEPIKLSVGADDWIMSPLESSPESAYTSQWEYSSAMDIGLLRFYHRDLTKFEVQLLAMEVLNGVFVADDFEAGQLQAKGMTAVSV